MILAKRGVSGIRLETYYFLLKTSNQRLMTIIGFLRYDFLMISDKNVKLNECLFN